MIALVGDKDNEVLLIAISITLLPIALSIYYQLNCNNKYIALHRCRLHCIALLSIALVCRQCSAMLLISISVAANCDIKCIAYCWLQYGNAVNCIALYCNTALHCCRLLWLAPRRRSLSTSCTAEHASAGHANSISWWRWWWWWWLGWWWRYDDDGDDDDDKDGDDDDDSNSWFMSFQGDQ